MVKNPPAMRETWVQSLGREDPLEEGTATHSSFLPGESHGQRSLGDYSPWGHKESDTTEQLSTARRIKLMYRLLLLLLLLSCLSRVQLCETP